MTSARQSALDSLLDSITGMLACHDLPETPPPDPMPLLLAWYQDAQHRGRYDDFNAMTLATSTPDGRPSARMVLCKAIELSPPAIGFFTSYVSRKGQEIESNARVAGVFHWPHAKRQARFEGVAERMSADESDTYFRSRPLLSRIGAAASVQSQHLRSRSDLIAAAMKTARNAVLAGDLARPEHWGGYRVMLNCVELWSAREGRLHDRMRWQRPDGAAPGVWEAVRLSA